MFCCFLRDAPAESNDVSTTPNQTADADTCSLAWAETATTPKQRKLRPGSTQKNQTNLEAETAWVHVCFGRPRVPNDLGLDADTCSLECWAESAPTPKQRKLRPGDKKPHFCPTATFTLAAGRLFLESTASRFARTHSIFCQRVALVSGVEWRIPAQGCVCACAPITQPFDLFIGILPLSGLRL